jgi:hypothetical protein
MRLPTGESGSLRVLHLVIRIILSLLLFLDRISGWDAVSWAMTRALGDFLEHAVIKFEGMISQAGQFQRSEL